MKIKEGVVIALFLLLLGGGHTGCTASLQKEKLSMDNIQKVDDRQYKLNLAIQYGLLPPPGRDFKDEFTAYYYSMHVAWAYGDEEEYAQFYEQIMTMLDEQEDELSVIEEEKSGVGGQEL